MAKILSNKKSTGGSPYAYYTVEATSSNRSTSSVDITIKVTSNLQADASSLGIGNNFGLIGYITLNNIEYSMTLKATNVTWKGTGKHTSTSTFNVDAPGSQEEIKNVKFRVSRTGSYANDYSRGAALSSTTCNNISIGIGHTPPSDVTFSLEETSQKLIDASVSETTYVKTLSNKKITLAYTLYDNATASKYGIQDKYNTYAFNTNPFIIDGSAIKDEVGNKITFKTFVIDSMGGTGYSNSIVYDYIDYNLVNLIETATTAKRDGQTSGKVKLNINGTFYNGTIGNVTQTKPTIKYKYWKLNDNEPTTFNNTISSNNISVTGNKFVVSNYEIGSTDETASNYFNPNNAYRVKIFVQDTFTTYASSEKSVPVGEATWSEYKDRVDFKKITVQGKNVLFYENEDTYQINNSFINVGGCITSGQKQLRFAIFTPKLLTNISSIVVNNAKLTARHVDGGYLLDAQDVTSRLEAYKAGDNTIYLVYVSSSAMNTTNNTPVTVEINNLKLTFSSVSTTELNLLNMEGDEK